MAKALNNNNSYTISMPEYSKFQHLNLNNVNQRGMFPRVFGDEFGDKFGDQFGDKFSELPNLVIILVMKPDVQCFPK